MTEIYEFLNKHIWFKLILLTIFMFYTQDTMETYPWIWSVIPLTFVISYLFLSQDLEYEIWTPNKPLSGLDMLVYKPKKNWYSSLFISLLLIVLGYSIAYLFEVPKTVEVKNIGQIYSLIIFGPIMEELIFRQGVYRDWLLKKLPKPVAFTFSVLIFTLLHLPPTSSQFIFYLIGSIAFNYLYDKSECDIRPVILLHIIHNWLAIQ